MPRFFIDAAVDVGHKVSIEGENALHIFKSLRMRPGETVELCDKMGTDYICRLTAVERDIVLAEVLSSSPTQSEPPVKVTLYMGVIKGEKMDFAIQKAVELGVDTIVPVITRRCVSSPDSKSEKNKLQRWNKISLEASKQSGRGKIPSVEAVMKFENAVDTAVAADLSLLAYEKADGLLGEFLEEKAFESVSLFVGPEGGFEEDEVAYASGAGIKIISLGKRILRAETAPLCALAIIHYHSETAVSKRHDAYVRHACGAAEGAAGKERVVK